MLSFIIIALARIHHLLPLREYLAYLFFSLSKLYLSSQSHLHPHHRDQTWSSFSSGPSFKIRRPEDPEVLHFLAYFPRVSRFHHLNYQKDFRFCL